MAEATFTPSLPPGGIVDAGFSGASQMQSLMERGQLMRQRKEMAVRQQAEFDVLRPVMEAKATADTVIAQNALKGAEMLQQFRAQYGQASKDAGLEYKAAMQLPTYEQQANALSDVAQKYSWFELIPEGKAFMQSIEHHRLQQGNYAILDAQHRNALEVVNSKGQQALDRERLRAEGRLSEIEAKGGGRSKEANDYIYASSIADENPQLAEQLRQHAINQAARKAGGSELIATEAKIAELQKDPNHDPRALENFITRAKTITERAKKQATAVIMEEAIKDAWSRGDERTARRLEANAAHAAGGDMGTYETTPRPDAKKTPVKSAVPAWLDRINPFSDSEPEAVKDESAPIKATKPPVVVENQKMTTVGGKQYPLFQKNGKMYYRKDDQFIPLP